MEQGPLVMLRPHSHFRITFPVMSMLMSDLLLLVDAGEQLAPAYTAPDSMELDLSEMPLALQPHGDPVGEPGAPTLSYAEITKRIPAWGPIRPELQEFLGWIAYPPADYMPPTPSKLEELAGWRLALDGLVVAATRVLRGLDANADICRRLLLAGIAHEEARVHAAPVTGDRTELWAATETALAAIDDAGKRDPVLVDVLQHKRECFVQLLAKREEWDAVDALNSKMRTGDHRALVAWYIDEAFFAPLRATPGAPDRRDAVIKWLNELPTGPICAACGLPRGRPIGMRSQICDTCATMCIRCVVGRNKIMDATEIITKRRCPHRPHV